METCANHPEHQAVERCEQCGRPLCGLCLWYAEDGRRLCEADAAVLADQGTRVTPPEAYAEAIRVTAVDAGQPPPRGSYAGNSLDLYGLLAAVVGGVTLASCSGLSYCLPLFAGTVGAYAYLNADRARDPRRTRRLAGIGLGVAGLMLLVILALFTVLGLSVALAVGASGRP